VATLSTGEFRRISAIAFAVIGIFSVAMRGCTGRSCTTKSSFCLVIGYIEAKLAAGSVGKRR